MLVCCICRYFWLNYASLYRCITSFLSIVGRVDHMNACVNWLQIQEMIVIRILSCSRFWWGSLTICSVSTTAHFTVSTAVVKIFGACKKQDVSFHKSSRVTKLYAKIVKAQLSSTALPDKRGEANSVEIPSIYVSICRRYGNFASNHQMCKRRADSGQLQKSCLW